MMLQKMTICIAFGIGLLGLAHFHAFAETPNAQVTLVLPAAGTIHTSGQGASPTLQTSNHYVEITGAPANQVYTVQWTLQVEIDGSALQGFDSKSGQTITCDGIGSWKHYPNNNNTNGGTISGSRFTGLGSHTATGYADLVNQNTGTHSTKQDDHSISIVNP
jgi:hypothetical protein